MPIKTLTSNPLSRVPLIARIFKGSEKCENTKGEKVYGKELDYFRLKFEPKYVNYAEAFATIYGSEPKVLAPVQLLGGTTPDAIWDEWLEEYNSRQVLVRRCDGINQVKWLGEDGCYHYDPRPCAEKCDCEERGRFKLYLPQFSAATGVEGVFLLQTGSVNDILNMRSALQFAHALYGDLSRVQWSLSRVPHKIDSPEMKQGKPTGKRIKVPHHLVVLEPLPEFVKHFGAQTGLALPATTEMLDQEAVDDGAPDEEARESVKVDWTRVYGTLKSLAHFGGVTVHVRNAINAMVSEGELARETDTETIIAAVLAKYGDDAQAAPDADDLDAYLNDEAEFTHEIPL